MRIGEFVMHADVTAGSHLPDNSENKIKKKKKNPDSWAPPFYKFQKIIKICKINIFISVYQKIINNIPKCSEK